MADERVKFNVAAFTEAAHKAAESLKRMVEAFRQANHTARLLTLAAAGGSTYWELEAYCDFVKDGGEPAEIFEIEEAFDVGP